MQKIKTFLWYDGTAEEAANLYVSIFKNSKINHVSPNGESGAAFLVEFELDGQKYLALNGGPMFQFTEAVSLYVDCEDQAEVDYLWDKLTSDGGQESMCGWLKDKYGLSWQIIPKQLPALISDSDPEKAGRAMQAMLQMQKIDVAQLEAAHRGEG